VFDSIRQNLFLRALRSLLDASKRQRKAYSFSGAKRIGVLFDATDADTGKELMSLIAQLERKGKEVKPFGFLKKKEAEIAFPYSVFTQKDCSWTGIPKSDECDDFAEKKFDLLVVINPEETMQVHWLACASQASMKISMPCELPHDFDMQLETPGKKGLPFFFEQLAFYLDKIELGSKHGSTNAV
jgi:hypothetical protein